MRFTLPRPLPRWCPRSTETCGTRIKEWLHPTDLRHTCNSYEYLYVQLLTRWCAGSATQNLRAITFAGSAIFSIAWWSVRSASAVPELWLRNCGLDPSEITVNDFSVRWHVTPRRTRHWHLQQADTGV